MPVTFITAGLSFFALMGLNADGSPDTTFGGGGGVVQCFGLAIQEDGRILAAGATENSDMAIQRFDRNGRLDRSFDGDGLVVTDFGGLESCRGVAVQKEGKIVAAGASEAVSSRIALARYLPNGRLDRSFDGDGKVFSPPGDARAAIGLAIAKDGRIVVAGFEVDIGGGGRTLVAHFQKNGRPDPSFGADGVVRTDFDSIAFAIAVGKDGRIVAAGIAGAGSIAVARFLAH